MNERYHVERIEGALIRKNKEVMNQAQHLENLTRSIAEEKNEVLRKNKIERFSKEKESLELLKKELSDFINISIPKYFKKHGIDNSIHKVYKM